VMGARAPLDGSGTQIAACAGWRGSRTML
jgi:hypothetical protein